MAQTYTTQFFSVSNGDTTTHNPQSLVSTSSSVNILNSEIRWRGNTSSNTTYDYSSNTNNGSATATSDTTTDKKASISSSNGTGTFDLPQNTGISDPPNGYDLDYIEIRYTVQNKEDAVKSILVNYEDVTGSTVEESAGLAAGASKTFTERKSSNIGQYIGETRGILQGTTSHKIELTTVIEVGGVDTTTTIQNDTATVSYPSVPNGYNFDRHYYREEKNGSFVESGYNYSNSVGNSRSVTSTDPNNTRSLEMKTRGQDSTTTTTDTQYPSVSGDVSASPGIANLGNDNTSQWYSLSGLAPNSENFNHSISGSNDAEFQFRFDYELALPQAVRQLRFYDAGSNQAKYVALADPSDSALDYNAVRVYVADAGQELAMDVVSDSSDPNAISANRIYHPTHGVLYPRAFDSSSL